MVIDSDGDQPSKTTTESSGKSDEDEGKSTNQGDKKLPDSKETKSGTNPNSDSKQDPQEITVQNNNATTDDKKEEPVSDYDFHSYKALDAFLKKYVNSSGNVNYAGIKADRSDLDPIIDEFKAQYPEDDWTKNQKLAFWINAYNVFTIQLVVDNYPTTSITKIAAKPWEIKCVKLKGHTYSLDHVENKIIRPQFGEPRVHFALNCASESCPQLHNKAYVAENLNYQLTNQTKKFLEDGTKNTFGKKEITISPIFEWYAADFTKNGSSVIDFINKYRSESLDSEVKIKYSTYSWELNK